MFPARNASFRNVPQISPERIAAMNDFNLGEPMRDLSWARAYRRARHSPLSEVRVNTEDKAKDGGCDSWTAKPKLDDDWLGDADTCWQQSRKWAGKAS